MVDGHAVNIPQPGFGETRRRRRSETHACRRNGTLKGLAIPDGGNVRGEARQYTKRMRGVTVAEEQAPEKIREGCLS